MAADQMAVFPTGEDRVDEAELGDRAGERLELIVVDPANPRRIDDELIERHGRDGDGVSHGVGPFGWDGAGASKRAKGSAAASSGSLMARRPREAGVSPNSAHQLRS